MIELIVSIVVIGITFMSVPLILTETSKNVETSFRQEAIMAGITLTQVVNIMSYRWDENETNESVNGGYAKILDTSSSSAIALNCSNYADGRRRVGNFKGTFRRKLRRSGRHQSGPYKQIVILDTTAVTGGSTNIKMVETQVVSENGERVVLRAFSTNIGEVKYFSRDIGTP